MPYYLYYYYYYYGYYTIDVTQHVKHVKWRFAASDSPDTVRITGNHDGLPRGPSFNFSRSSESLWALVQPFFVLLRGKRVIAAKVVAVKLSYTNCAAVRLQWDREPSWMEPNCWQPHIFGVNQLRSALQCIAWLAKAVHCLHTCPRLCFFLVFLNEVKQRCEKTLKGYCRFQLI